MQYHQKNVFGLGKLSSVGRYFTIDPDGPFGVDPFTVRCSGTRTIVEVDEGILYFGMNVPTDESSKVFTFEKVLLILLLSFVYAPRN